MHSAAPFVSRLVIVVGASADELPGQGLGGDMLFIQGLNFVQAPEDVLHHLVLPFGKLLQQGDHKGLQGAGAEGQGGVEHQIRVFLVGGDIQPLSPADVLPQLQSKGRVAAPELEVPDNAAAEADPGLVKHQRTVLVQNIAPGGDIELEGSGVLSHDDVVQGVDALENRHVVLPQPHGPGEDVRAHLPGKLILRNMNQLPPVQHGEVLVQQVHIQAEGGLIVNGSLPVPGEGLRVHGLEIVVHGNRVGHNAHLHQLFLDFQRGGGLPGAGGAGEEDDVGLPPVIRNLPGGGGHLFRELLIALPGEGGGVAADGFVDLL